MGQTDMLNVGIYIYMNDYLYYNVTNRYYWHLLDTYHIPYLSIASYYWFPMTF